MDPLYKMSLRDLLLNLFTQFVFFYFLVKVLKIVYNRLVDGFRKCGLRKCGLWKCKSFTVAADRIGRAFVAVDINHF